MNEHESHDEQHDETTSGDHVEVRRNIEEQIDERIDERASAWLDSDASTSSGLEGDISGDVSAEDQQSSEALDRPSARRIADLQFLHVLLNELHHGTAELNSARVQRAMAAIHDEPSFFPGAPVSVPSAQAPVAVQSLTASTLSDSAAGGGQGWSRRVADRRTWLIPAAAMAAGLAGVALWLMPAGSAQAAYAAVLRVAADARIPKDRQYRVTQTLIFDKGEQRRIESDLYVRGGEKHVLRHRGPLGIVWMGSNGREGWLIPALGPPIITDNPRYPARWAREEGLALPDLQLTGLLDLMRERFQLSMLREEALPSRPDILCEHISGWCDANDGGANRIELWAHPDTGVAERLVLEWNRSPGDVGLSAIQLDFLGEARQADEWYEAESHRHGRPIFPKVPLLPSAQ